ncbi:hypothetical protein HYS72_00575 [Candidatus Pacearchaeota archaeon]|nr:hypothetical protein [Candidatus Pacearchaeota archaeon]
MMEKTKIHLISSDKNSSFESDIYFTKRIKEIKSKKSLDVVFADSFEKFPVLQRYCSRYGIETNKVTSSNPQENYNKILDYMRENLDKKGLAYLLKSEEADKLYNLLQK